MPSQPQQPTNPDRPWESGPYKVQFNLDKMWEGWQDIETSRVAMIDQCSDAAFGIRDLLITEIMETTSAISSEFDQATDVAEREQVIRQHLPQIQALQLKLMTLDRVEDLDAIKDSKLISSLSSIAEENILEELKGEKCSAFFAKAMQNPHLQVQIFSNEWIDFIAITNGLKAQRERQKIQELFKQQTYNTPEEEPFNPGI